MQASNMPIFREFPFRDKYVRIYGEIKFGEIENSCLDDFETSYDKFFSEPIIEHERYIIAEIGNSSMKDYKKSFKKYFS
jgi:hypothetical protein